MLFKQNKQFSLLVFLFCSLIIIYDQIYPPVITRNYSKLVLADDGTLLSAYLSTDDKWRMRASLEEISPDLINAIIAKEDKYFYYHRGINPIAVFRALLSNLSTGRRVSGASTITMQLCRMNEPAERNYFSKFREILRAIQLECHFSKKEILEMYLNKLPYGGNVEGVKAASYIFFNRPPSQLSLAQSVLLTIIPNNPNYLRLDRRKNNSSMALKHWLQYFNSKRVFSKQDIMDALNENIVAQRHEVPTFAQHFCLRVANENNGDILHSTLNLRIQRITETLLSKRVEQVQSKGVSNGCALVIDNKTMNVVAYCGSANFSNAAASGQVDGIIATRSPGSTLKPALYAMAFAKGILTPKMRMLDIPLESYGFEPENYSQKFNGWVNADYALKNSLNLPAVRLLDEIGMNDFISLLEKYGFQNISKNRKKLGLSMILGGCGVQLDELVSMYASFANKGEIKLLNYLNNSSQPAPINALSNDAVYILSQVLSSNDRPDFSDELLQMTNMPKIAWKTGTSFGKKDAWAIGYNPRFTIGVWMGNFDGTGSPHLSGAEMAVPLLFELFNAIDCKENNHWFEKPKNVGKREVCAETGKLPGKYCASLVSDYFIKNVTANEQCDLYKEIFVSLDGSMQYCTECLPLEGYRIEVYPIYAAELTSWFESEHIDYQKPPPHNPNCTARFSNAGPKIISPSLNFEYLLEKGANQQIMLKAASAGNVSTYYWYLDDNFFGKCSPKEHLFFVPHSGKNKITCLDENGRTQTITIFVKYY